MTTETIVTEHDQRARQEDLVRQVIADWRLEYWRERLKQDSTEFLVDTIWDGWVGLHHMAGSELAREYVESYLHITADDVEAAAQEATGSGQGWDSPTLWEFIVAHASLVNTEAGST